MSRSFAVAFAGVPGSSKTIISNYLSTKFNLPVFNNDQLRFEVKEDMRAANINIPEVLDEYERRYTERFEDFLSTGHSMLLDGSIDRRWGQTKKQLKKFGYAWFVIDMEFSPKFLEEFFIATGRPKFLDQLSKYLDDHAKFMKKYVGDVGVQITDDQFYDRLKIAESALRKFINDLENGGIKS